MKSVRFEWGELSCTLSLCDAAAELICMYLPYKQHAIYEKHLILIPFFLPVFLCIIQHKCPIYILSNKCINIIIHGVCVQDQEI